MFGITIYSHTYLHQKKKMNKSDSIGEAIENLEWPTNPVETKGVLWRFSKSWLKAVSAEIASSLHSALSKRIGRSKLEIQSKQPELDAIRGRWAEEIGYNNGLDEAQQIIDEILGGGEK